MRGERLRGAVLEGGREAPAEARLHAGERRDLAGLHGGRELMLVLLVVGRRVDLGVKTTPGSGREPCCESFFNFLPRLADIKRGLASHA